jgi:hypothetical protein
MERASNRRRIHVSSGDKLRILENSDGGRQHILENFKKWFTALKKGNHFTEIKEGFYGQSKNVFSLTMIFSHTKYQKIEKMFFVKHFTSKQRKS